MSIRRLHPLEYLNFFLAKIRTLHNFKTICTINSSCLKSPIGKINFKKTSNSSKLLIPCRTYTQETTFWYLWFGVHTYMLCVIAFYTKISHTKQTDNKHICMQILNFYGCWMRYNKIHTVSGHLLSEIFAGYADRRILLFEWTTNSNTPYTSFSNRLLSDLMQRHHATIRLIG